jgi:uncharacterized protein (DUF433 family)
LLSCRPTRAAELLVSQQRQDEVRLTLTSRPYCRRAWASGFRRLSDAVGSRPFRARHARIRRDRPDVIPRLRSTRSLASTRLYTDGAEVLYDHAAGRNEDDLLELVVLRTGQHQFSDVVRDYLKRITYGSDGWASRVRLPSYQRAEVVVDPRVAFGLPLVVHGGARVEDLVDRFVAGDTLCDIAFDFGVPPEEVEDVIRVATRSAA